MKEKGTVIKIENGIATILIHPEEVCTKCCSCNASKKRYSTISGEQARGLKEGESVEIEVDPSVMMKAYVFLYAVPLIVFVSSALILYQLTHIPGVSFIAALINTSAAYLLIGKYLRSGDSYVPSICGREQTKEETWKRK